MRTTMLCSIAALSAFSATGQTTVLATDFDTVIPTEINPGVATLTGVQGYAGLGHAGNQFGGQFLRSPTGNTVTLTMSNLPPHNAVNVLFLFAAIDSLDGTGNYPEGDFFHVTVDGTTIFRESFANATADQIQSYVAPPGVTLARRVDLGFSEGGYYLDSAYDLSLDPTFSNIPHSASTLTVTFIIEGPGIQSLDDESWAMDNLRIQLVGACPADFNQDGFVDFFDFNDFVTCFEGGTCPRGTSADFNGDGFADFFDFNDFVNAFEAGC